MLVGNRLFHGHGRDSTEIGLSEVNQDGHSQGGKKWSDPGAFGLCPALFRDEQDCGSSSFVGEMAVCLAWSCPTDMGLQSTSKPVDMQVKGFCIAREKEVSRVGTHPHTPLALLLTRSQDFSPSQQTPTHPLAPGPVLPPP